MNYYIYILFSESSQIFYIGYTSNFEKRVFEHNNDEHNTFTSKHRPWHLKALFSVGSDKSTALKIERYLKKQKSKSLILKLIDLNFIPTAKLAQLVRVPHVRD